MKRRHFAFLWLFLMLAGTIVIGTGCGQVYDSYASVCQIHVNGGQGSGCLIGLNGDKALVLSCRHVAEHVGAAASFDWIGAGGQKTTGTVLAIVPGTEMNNDIALFVCEAPAGVRPLPVGVFDAEAGPWHCLGYRGGVFYESVALTAREHDNVITLDEPLIKGQSGGPCIDSRGLIVGVAVGSDVPSGGSTGQSFAIASDGVYLQELVTAHSK